MHQFDLKNRTAIITGGAQGFGLRYSKKIFKAQEQKLLSGT